MTDEEIATMAREVARCSWHHRHHKAARNSTRCVHEVEHDKAVSEWLFGPLADPEPEGSDPPCWKVLPHTYPTGNADGPREYTVEQAWGGDRDEWCDNCRDRQYHHEQMLVWLPLARAAKGRLTRALDQEAGRGGAR